MTSRAEKLWSDGVNMLFAIDVSLHKHVSSWRRGWRCLERLWGTGDGCERSSHGDVISLRHIVHAQMSEITELQSETGLEGDSLKDRVMTLQGAGYAYRASGPAGGPAQLELPEDWLVAVLRLDFVMASRFKMAPKRATRSTRAPPVTPTPNETTTTVTEAQLQALIDQGVAAAMAEAEASRVRNGYNSNGSGPRPAQTARECSYSEFLKCKPLDFKDPTILKHSHEHDMGSTEEIDDDKKEKKECDFPKNNKTNRIKRQNTVVKSHNIEGPCHLGANNCQEGLVSGVGIWTRMVGADLQMQHNNNNNVNKQQHQLITTTTTTTDNNNNNNHNNNNNNQQGNGCFECGAQGHFKRNCPRLRNNDRGNQAGNDWESAKVCDVVGIAGGGGHTRNVICGFSPIEGSRKSTFRRLSFKTHYGHLRIYVMPFGLTNAPAYSMEPYESKHENTLTQILELLLRRRELLASFPTVNFGFLSCASTPIRALRRAAARARVLLVLQCSRKKESIEEYVDEARDRDFSELSNGCALYSGVVIKRVEHEWATPMLELLRDYDLRIRYHRGKQMCCDRFEAERERNENIAKSAGSVVEMLNFQKKLCREQKLEPRQRMEPGAQCSKWLPVMATLRTGS
ncbi:putative reverse transcriptase domain-containing protein [Tanacetum coccineum]